MAAGFQPGKNKVAAPTTNMMPAGSMGHMQDTEANQRAAAGFIARVPTGSSTVLPNVPPPLSTNMPAHPDTEDGQREQMMRQVPKWVPGLKNGGELKTGHGGKVPGSGKGDKVPAEYEPGEFVVSNAMLDAQPGLHDQLQALRTKVLGTKGMTPGQADAQALSGKTLRAATGFTSDEEKKNSFGDAAAASQSAAVQQIPTGGNSRAPAADGSQNSTELSRNVNNGLNALGGMGAMASVPLGFGKAAMSAAPQLANPVAKLGMSGAADFVAGMGPASTVAAAAPAAKAIPYLPGVNAALQEGAQANALAGATRSMAGAGAALTVAENSRTPSATATAPTAPNDPAAPTVATASAPDSRRVAVAAPAAPASTPVAEPPSEYGRQMGAVGNALLSGPMTALKTLVSAPGYGFNQEAAPTVPVTGTGTAGAGRGAGTDPRVLGNPGTIAAQTSAARPAAQTLPPALAPAVTPAVAAAPVNPNAPTGNVTRTGNSYSGGNVAGDITINGQAPRNGGFISEQNRDAAQALSDRYQTQTQSGPNLGFQPSYTPTASEAAGNAALASQQAGADRLNLRDPANLAARNASVSGSSNTGGLSARQVANNQIAQQNAATQQASVQNANANAIANNATAQRGQDVTMASNQLQDKRSQASNDIAKGKLGIDQKELGLKTTESGFKTRAANRLEAAQTAFRDAKTPEEKASAEENVRAEQGKYERLVPDLFSTTAIPFKTDPVTGNISGGGAIVTDRRTGSTRIISADEAKGQTAAPSQVSSKADFDKLPAGTTYIGTDGKTYKK